MAEDSPASSSSSEDLDAAIEIAADRANLSITNVKSILHHVVKDKRVLSLVQRKAAEGEDVQLEDLPEPRLTRSRVREAVAAVSPEKIARMRAITKSPTKHGGLSVEDFLDVSLGESSDEEYVPGEGGSDSEEEQLPDSLPEACISPLRPTPPAEETTPTQDIEQEAATLLASLSDVILSPVKTRGQSTGSPEPGEGADGRIAHRTRSKFSLNDTPLEELFPVAESGELAPPTDLDEDDLEWATWLNNLMNPATSQDDSIVEGDDDEYNFQAEQDVVEREELRNDRAVKIPRKEVDQLLNELLYPPTDGLGGLLSGDTVDPVSVYLLESLGLEAPVLTDEPPEPAESATPRLTLEQSRELSTQIQQHFQLLLTTFLLSHFEPSLALLCQASEQAVREVASWSRAAEQGVQSAVWFVPDIATGEAIIEALKSMPAAHHERSNAAKQVPVPMVAQDIMMNTPLFWNHPALLPAVGFTPLDKHTSCYFTPAEDCLLVLGMERFGPVSWQQIIAHQLPTKTVKQLQLRVKNQISKRTGENIIKHYKKTKEIRIPFHPDDDKPKDLPQWVMQYYKKLEEREKASKELSDKLKAATDKLVGMIKQRGSKRNLAPILMKASGDLPTQSHDPGERSPDHKKVKLDERRKARKQRKRIISRKNNSSPGPTEGAAIDQSSLGQVLLAAGLEPSNSSARFAYNYINEVKRTLPADGVKYSQFLSLLQQADKDRLPPTEIFSRLSELLSPWPHLVQLSTELLTTQQALQINRLGAKMATVSVREFTESLKRVQEDQPIDLRLVLEQLAALDQPNVSTQQIEQALLPLLKSHDTLVSSLRRFLYQLPPPNKEGQWEELDMSRPSDDFETISEANIRSAVSRDQPQWTRREDGLILRGCLRERGQRSLDTVLSQLASSLGRPQQEVETRYTELLSLLNTNKSSTTNS